ncbi:MAG: 2Fe-2S iron-sulfur cluster binding domain-containing protein [Planctomycetaceae bacterium]|nr:2Fe-2S iron-sulfur cluster binding domain-containing protein [Planctomycetaceae bacterium]
MGELHYRGEPVAFETGESALDALERADLGPKGVCRAGLCGACLVRVRAGDVPERARQGLAPRMVAQGAAFACCLVGPGPFDLVDLGDAGTCQATIEVLETIGRDVVRVGLRTEMPLDFRPGQYVVLERADGIERSYSIASLPSDAHVELHVRRTPGGALSPWFFDAGALGQSVRLRGPLGTCCYEPGRPDQALVLAGAGTGLAPLLGILRDALAHGHRGPIDLYHGARDEGGLYYRAELGALARAHQNLTVHGCVLAEPAVDRTLRTLGLGDAVLADRSTLEGTRVFLCGDGTLVKSLKRRFFLAGAASRDLLSDPFELSPKPARVAGA